MKALVRRGVFMAVSFVIGTEMALAYNISDPGITDVCTVSVQNRTAILNSDYSYQIDNVPAVGALIRVSLVCPALEFPFSGTVPRTSSHTP